MTGIQAVEGLTLRHGLGLAGLEKIPLKFTLVTDIKVVQLLLVAQLVLSCLNGASASAVAVVIRAWESRKEEGLFVITVFLRSNDVFFSLF